MPFPLFHAAGLGSFMSALFQDTVIVLPPPVPLTAELANEVHVHGNVQPCQLPPAILVEMTKVPEYFENLGRVNYMCTGGGPLLKSIGHLISSRTHLCVAFGSTEMGPFLTSLPSREDWDYFDFSAAFGVDMRPFTDELYELVIVRKPEVEAYQGVFYTFPELSEYKTNDLFTRHPTKDGLWRHQGRSDDIIVYSTGEKFNPISMEDTLCSDPNIKSAIVYGTGKFQSVLLIEPHDQDKSKASLLDEIWPSIHKANEVCPAHARIEKDFIIFTSPDKPLPRAGKGTVQRKLVLHLYQTELDGLYQDAADGLGSKEKPSSNTTEDLPSTIRTCVANLEGFQSVSSTDNFFEMGMDSLGVISLARALNSSFKARNSNSKPVSESMIYAHPTIESLALALGESGIVGDQSHEAMQRQYDIYSADLAIVARPLTKKTGHKTFLLTGSTGSLGSYILESILSADQTCKVYCLNRGSDSQERQYNSNISKGLSTNFDRVEFLSMGSSAGEQWLGLQLPQYKKLLNEVTHVIHNAWHVNFNVSLDQVGPEHIRRVRQLIDFSAHSRYGCSIHFISTIGTVGNWDIATSAKPGSRVPEVVFEDWSLPQGAGYGQAKFVAERLLAAACRDVGIPTAIYRVGQIAGPTTDKGKWNESEWFPLILRSSMYLKVLPSTLGPVEDVDWIPVDVLGRVVQELVVGSKISNVEPVEDEKLEPAVYHLVNPKSTTYTESVLPCVASQLELPDVPFEEWVERLRESAADAQATDVERNPAVKLLEFFESLVDMEKVGRSQVWLDTTRAVEDSKVLREMDVVSGTHMVNWLRQWGLGKTDGTQ
ncbi:NRPS-like enzyme protein [Rutstroemia sp. NJR-2017a WRK4]|nr:NRPS-like enzyme protein [Rutstroemia sp. NJR-2017a WRK4]